MTYFLLLLHTAILTRIFPTTFVIADGRLLVGNCFGCFARLQLVKRQTSDRPWLHSA
ncbi:hypothetical protein [Nostoc sp. PCC 7120 = FACHB-418]|uniref:hypothetical protein n=1 Tax=Nostoc sp. (strain PCC 7120 / SAG 25.82 / UTEX 2576) TaxID=103690 RepID=UPI00131505D2|nr:hypothetical protein [Nostoc sp. PCC 7120 = FACHB-418]